MKTTSMHSNWQQDVARFAFEDAPEFVVTDVEPAEYKTLVEFLLRKNINYICERGGNGVVRLVRNGPLKR